MRSGTWRYGGRIDTGNHITRRSIPAGGAAPVPASASRPDQY